MWEWYLNNSSHKEMRGENPYDSMKDAKNVLFSNIP